MDHKRIEYYATWVIRCIILIAAGIAIWQARWSVLFISLLIFFITFFPNFVEKRYKIDIPVEFELVIVLFLFASLFLGELHGYYTRYWWWDVVLHSGSALCFGLIGFLVLYVLFTTARIQARPMWVAFFTFCFAIAMGALWEIFEFAMDQLLGTNMQKSGLVDTMWDLIIDSIGGAIAAISGFIFLKSKRKGLFRHLITAFLKANPKWKQ